MADEDLGSGAAGGKQRNEDFTIGKEFSSKTMEEKVPIRGNSCARGRYGTFHKDSTEGPSKNVTNEDSVSPTRDSVKLKRSLGLFNGVAVIVGTIVGSGIFVSPKGVLQESGSVGVSLIIWCVAGIICLIGALCFAELGTCIKKSGGQYAYLQEFGPLPAFLYLWASLIITFPAANAVIALTCAHYILQPFFSSCAIPSIAVSLFAALSIIALSTVNCISVKWASRVQDVFTVVKCLALILIILTGIVVLAMGHTINFKDPWENTSTDPGKIALAFYSGLFSYSGWYSLNFLTEELQNPYRNLPLAIWIALPTVTAIYTLTNVAYFAVLTVPEILESDAVAVTFSIQMYGFMSWVMPVFVACSAFGSLNGCLLSISRVTFVGAREGHLPGFLSLINYELYTPFPAVIFQGLMSCLFLITSDVYLLINYVSMVEAMGFAATIAVLLVLRWRKPHLVRPIKVNIIFPVFYLLVCIFLVVFPIYTSPAELGIAIAIVASGFPVYFLAIYVRKPDCFLKFMKKITHVVQILTLGVAEEGDSEDHDK